MLHQLPPTPKIESHVPARLTPPQPARPRAACTLSPMPPPRPRCTVLAPRPPSERPSHVSIPCPRDALPHAVPCAHSHFIHSFLCSLAGPPSSLTLKSILRVLSIAVGQTTPELKQSSAFIMAQCLWVRNLERLRSVLRKPVLKALAEARVGRPRVDWSWGTAVQVAASCGWTCEAALAPVRGRLAPLRAVMKGRRWKGPWRLPPTEPLPFSPSRGLHTPSALTCRDRTRDAHWGGEKHWKPSRRPAAAPGDSRLRSP